MLARFLGRARRAVGLASEVTLLLASSAELRRLNRQFRGKDYATDVLSFPSGFAGYSGDIAISADLARHHGKLLGHGPTVETKLLVLHGLLHLAGHDHESDHGQMARQELRLRRALGLPVGLIERTQGAPKPEAPASKSAPASRARGSRKR